MFELHELVGQKEVCGSINPYSVDKNESLVELYPLADISFSLLTEILNY